MTQYLYGAAVQGIQSFIFQTNKLREIVGASELVEEICTAKFYEMLTNQKNVDAKTAQEALIKDNNAILHAAGNIIYIFDDEIKCKKLVEKAPKTIQEFAPGITFSQAVVKMEGKFEKFEDAVIQLHKLLKTQRNKLMRSQTLGLMGIKRSPQTGLPLVDNDVDIAQKQKFKMENVTQQLCQKAFGSLGIESKQNYIHLILKILLAITIGLQLFTPTVTDSAKSFVKLESIKSCIKIFRNYLTKPQSNQLKKHTIIF